MILRSTLLATVLLLCGCAPTLKYPPGQTLLGITPSEPAWSAASVRAHYRMQWKTRRNDLRFEADLRTLGSMGRLDLATPAGTALAQVFWNGDHWKALFPGSSTLVEGDGPTLPLPMLGIAAFPLMELERIGRGVLIPLEAQGRPMSALYSGKGTRVLLSDPDSTARRWALHIEEKTGIVRRIQCFQGPVQEADLQYQAFLPHTLIPSSIRREFDTSSVLTIQSTTWSDRDFVSPTELSLASDAPLDTVTIDQDRLGRRFYTIRPSKPDSLAPFPSDFLSQGTPAVVDSSEEITSAEDSTTDSLDTTDDSATISEDDMLPEDETPPPAPKLAPPALPDILKEAPQPSDPPARIPSASDTLPLAPPPSESLPRRF